MRSISDPAVYAVGECAECDNRTHGFVAPLFAQAKVLAAHIAGRQTAPYRDTAHGTQLKVSGVDLYSAGDFGATEGAEAILYLDQGMDIYKKVVLRDHRVVGCVLFGDTADGPRLLDLIRSQADVTAIRSQLLQAGAASSPGMQFSAGPAGFSVVCGCQGVVRGDVVEAIRGYGLTDIYGVMSETRAGRGCGACHGAIQALLNETMSGVAA
jgi:nitrite reductase (NADH) large subunit